MRSRVVPAARLRACAVAIAMGVAVPATIAPIAARAPADGRQAAEDARTWRGRAPEIEAYLKTATIVRLENLPVGVTRPRRGYLEPGGPAASLVWKPIRPGLYNGYWESYKSEIAAYELDKFLELGMVPPTVERRHDGQLGAAVMWASPTRSFTDLGGAPKVPPEVEPAWSRQLIRAKMFHNLIANTDPNLGNWLVDPAWNLILIDHTRAFTPVRTMTHELTRVDGALWDRMTTLTEEGLTAALQPHLDRGQIRAVLQRRDRMTQIVDGLVKARGRALVIIR